MHLQTHDAGKFRFHHETVATIYGTWLHKTWNAINDSKTMLSHEQIWSNMIKYDQTWSNQSKHDQTWSNMIKYGETHDQTWSNMIKHDQTWSNAGGWCY